jgi:diacylglycerol kinase family enzyme
VRAVLVFLNPRSGHHHGHAADADAEDQHAAAILRLFVARQVPCRLIPLSRSLDLFALLRDAPPGTIAVAAGGDGTVNAVANAAARTNTPMAVLPLGTLNHFARDLGLPLPLEAAIDLIATGTPRPVDLAEVNALRFVNNSSLGAYPAMVMDRERLKRSGWNKWISLAWASLRAFFRLRQLHVELTVQGHVRHVTTPFLFVGNNEYGIEAARLGRREHLTGGRLFLYLAPNASRRGVARLTLAALIGRIRHLPDLEELCVDHFSVHVRGRRIRVSLDGEVRRIRGPLHYRILPAGLSVIQPDLPQPELEAAQEAEQVAE